MQQVLQDVSEFVEKRLRWIITSSSVLPPDTTSTSDEDFEEIWQRGGGDGERRSSRRLSTHTSQEQPSSFSPTKKRNGVPASSSSSSSSPIPPQRRGKPTTKERFMAMLFCAVYDGDVTTVRRMINFLHCRSPDELASFVNPLEIVPFCQQPYSIVHYAVASKSAEMVELILFFEGDLVKLIRVLSVSASSSPPQSVTPMHLAVALGSFDMVRTLLAAGAPAQALRGAPSRRISALQDALQQLGDSMSPGELHANGSAGGAAVRPLYSRDGISEPVRRPQDSPVHVPPWQVWVDHGEEERAKISRGAWRTDTGSFFRSRTPSPLDAHRGGRVRITSDDDDPTMSKGRRPQGRVSDGSSSNEAGDALTSPVGGPVDNRQPQPQRSVVQSPSTHVSDPSTEDISSTTAVPMTERPVFKIAVLLLHQGAEMIFNKTGMSFRAMQHLQRATGLVQRELHRRIQNHDDTGLALVIGQAAEVQQQLQQLDASPNVDAATNVDEHGSGRSRMQLRGRSPSSDGEEDSEASDDDDGGGIVERRTNAKKAVVTITTSETIGGGGGGRQKGSAKAGSRQESLTMARLMATVTPSHEMFISRVIAARAREQHIRRVGRLSAGPRALLPPLTFHDDAAHAEQTTTRLVTHRMPSIGSAVWIRPCSRYCPTGQQRRHISSLLHGARATRQLENASGELLRNDALCLSVVERTNELLRLISYGGDLNAPTTVLVEEPSPRKEGKRRGAAALRKSDDDPHTLPPPSVPMIAISMEANNNAHEAAPAPPVAAAVPLTSRSIVKVTQTSQMKSSQSGGAVFSQSLKVGSPETVVGCVACIVSLPDHVADAMEAAFHGATSGAEEELQSSFLDPAMHDDVDADRVDATTRCQPPPPSRRRLFAGLIVEPTCGASAGGYLVPQSVLRAREQEQRDQAVLLSGSTGRGPNHLGGPSSSPLLSEVEEAYQSHVVASSPIVDIIGRTMPYCSLFVPISDLVVVDHAAAAEVAEHRLRRSLNAVTSALEASRRAMDKKGEMSAPTTMYASNFPQVRRHVLLGDPAAGAQRLHADRGGSEMRRWLRARRKEEEARDRELAAIRRRRF